MKKFWVDNLALNIFIVITAFFVEVVFSGIPLSVFWKGRLIMIIPNTIVVEPYNLTRNWFDSKFCKFKSNRLRQVSRDTLTFIIYRVPLVFIVLTMLGAPMINIINAVVVATLISGFTGRPYGIFLDWFRRLFKI